MNFMNLKQSSYINSIEACDQLKNEFYSSLKNDYSVFEFRETFGLNGIWYWNPANTWFVWSNSGFWNGLGYTLSESVNRHAICQNLVRENNLRPLMSEEIDFDNDEEFPIRIISCLSKDNKPITIQAVFKKIKNFLPGENRIIAGFTVKRDLTEVKTGSHHTDQLSKVLSNSKIGVWDFNLFTNEMFCDAQCAEILGYQKDEMMRFPLTGRQNLIHPEDYDVQLKAINDYLHGKTTTYNCDFRVKHNDGNWIRIKETGKIVAWNSEGMPERIVGTQMEIAEAEKKYVPYASLVENAPSAIALLDRNLCYLAHSKKWLADYGIKDESIVGRSHYEIFPEIPDRWKQDHQKCLKGEVLRNNEDQFIRENGKVQYISWELHPWYVDQKVEGLIMMSNDVTRLKEAELKLKLSERRFKSSFKNAAAGMVIVDLNGMFLEVNNTFCKLTGYTSDELMNINFLDITHPDDLIKDHATMIKLKSGEIDFSHLTKRYIHKKGTFVDVVLSVSVVRDEFSNPLYYVAQILDVTPMVKAQTALQKTLAKLEAVLEASTEISIIGTDTNGKVILFNRGAEKLLGYERKEVINKCSPDTFHDKQEIRSYIDELAIENLQLKTMHDVLSYQVRDKGYYSQEWNYVTKSNNKIPVLLTVTPIKEDGDITGYLKVAVNMESIKKNEAVVKNLLNVTIDQNARLKNFAHIVSHNLRSHAGNFNMLMNLYQQEESEQGQKEIIKLLSSASSGLSQTIEHLHEIIKINTTVEENLKSIALKEVFEKVFNQLSYIKNETNFNVVCTISSKINVKGVYAYIESIFLNLLTNSYKYRRRLENSFVKVTASRKGKVVILEFKDNGLGIDLNLHKGKLFGMYKTFHDHKDALGMGLFITKNQVEAMGGRIEADSEVNVGTTFKIYLENGEN